MNKDTILKAGKEIMKRVVPCIVIEIFLRLIMVLEYGKCTIDITHFISYVIICVLVNMYIDEKMQRKWWVKHFKMYSNDISNMFEDLFNDVNDEIKKVENEMQTADKEEI